MPGNVSRPSSLRRRDGTALFEVHSLTPSRRAGSNANICAPGRHWRPPHLDNSVSLPHRMMTRRKDMLFEERRSGTFLDIDHGTICRM